MDGFIIIDKPKGITSFSLCNQVRKKLNLNKTGHNGTLDPNATGLMVIACDKATKLMRLINEHDKEYIAEIIFGKTSDTLDIDSIVSDGKYNSFTKEELLNAIDKLKHEEEQLPPMISAIKVDGKKLYEYQRKGIEVKVEKRKVKINDIELIEYDINNKKEGKKMTNDEKRLFLHEAGHYVIEKVIRINVTGINVTRKDNIIEAGVAFDESEVEKKLEMLREKSICFIKTAISRYYEDSQKDSEEG